ncbi:MAG TPA: hypothetical protein VHR38_00650 [Solirubrobacterales bacterium]|nr:hypothetical protein [Solirubrobacterales bacterium]
MPNSGKEVLAREVYVGDGYKKFGELTPDDARMLAEQFSGLSGGGLEAKVAPVGRAWRDLADLLSERECERVADLGADRAAGLAEKLRVVPPGGSWLSS